MGKTYKIQNSEKILNSDVHYVCGKCKISKPETHFRLDKKQKPGHRHSCYQCEAYSRHVSSTKQRVKENSLSESEFNSIIIQPCAYCNGENWTNETVHINGIDRVMNEYGYHLWNCVPCCNSCNTFKSNKDVKYFTRFFGNYFRVVEKCALDRAFIPWVRTISPI
jgi:5-methylcytosine-specific restriction endonuclease McrA